LPKPRLTAAQRRELADKLADSFVVRALRETQAMQDNRTLMGAILLSVFNLKPGSGPQVGMTGTVKLADDDKAVLCADFRSRRGTVVIDCYLMDMDDFTNQFKRLMDKVCKTEEERAAFADQVRKWISNDERANSGLVMPDGTFLRQQ
jgi:hypothetical protein